LISFWVFMGSPYRDVAMRGESSSFAQYASWQDQSFATPALHMPNRLHAITSAGFESLVLVYL